MAALVSLAAGCGLRQVKLNPTTLVPSAFGRLHVGHTTSGVTTLLMQVRALAYPWELTPPRRVYVVWIAGLTNGAPTESGILRVGPQLRATLRTTTLLRAFDIFVTAEDQAHPLEPSGPEVLRASVDGH
ncbi:MAG: hypothetical protein ACRD2F_09550 [Terriglobales bacterium]